MEEEHGTQYGKAPKMKWKSMPELIKNQCLEEDLVFLKCKSMEIHCTVVKAMFRKVSARTRNSSNIYREETTEIHPKICIKSIQNPYCKNLSEKKKINIEINQNGAEKEANIH